MKNLTLIILVIFCTPSFAQTLDGAVRRLFSLQRNVDSRLTAVSSCTTFTVENLQVNPRRNPAQFHREIEFDLNRTPQTARFQDDQISVLTEEEAQHLFKIFSEIEYLKFDYLHDGCFARAHELALIAERNGIKMGKVFLSDKSDDASLYPEGWRDNSNAPVPSGFVGWRYHVTPYVFVQKDGELVPFVFDVGVAERSQSLPEWKRSLQTNNNTQTTFRDRGYIYESGRSYDPDNSNIASQFNDQELIRELGINEFLFLRMDGKI